MSDDGIELIAADHPRSKTPLWQRILRVFRPLDFDRDATETIEIEIKPNSAKDDRWG